MPFGLSHALWTTIGDMGNALLVLSSVSYAYAVVMVSNGNASSIFSPDWLREGFCIAQVNEWTTSHEICCIVNIILGIFLLILYGSCGKSAGMEYANKYAGFFALGMLGHGMAHGYIGYRLQSFDGSMEALVEMASSRSNTTFIRDELPMAVFVWFPLIQATMPDTNSMLVFMVSLVVKMVQSYVPLRFLFGYVQTILISAFALDQTFQPKGRKGFLYATLVWIPGIIPSVSAWLESTHCGAIREHFYGHVLYDASLAVCFIGWYIMACATRRRDLSNVSPEGKRSTRGSSAASKF